MKVTLGKLSNNAEAVLHHFNIDARHELLPHAAHRQRTRRKLIRPVAFDNLNFARKSILKKIEGDARSHHPAANNDNIHNLGTDTEFTKTKTYCKLRHRRFCIANLK